MWNKIKRVYHCLVHKGLPLPLGYDPVSDKPSITITFAHATFTLACISYLRYLHGDSPVMHVFVGIGFWATATVFYLIRQITSAKFDLDDKSFSISNGGEAEEKSTKHHKNERNSTNVKDNRHSKVDDPDAE